MAEPTLLSDEIHPAWMGLTADQRICWHFWAAAHPMYDQGGQLRTLYGAQAHYKKNADIAVTETNPLLADPPATTTPPLPVAIITVAWPLQSLISGTTTARRGLVYLDLDEVVPVDAAVIVRQGYDKKHVGRGRPPRIRHVTIIQPLDVGAIALDIPTGYYATTAGNNKFATIRGRTAQRRPDKPLGTVRIVNLTNGQTVRQVLSNPFGGSKTKSNRARATAVDPLSGVNHFP